MVGYLPLSKPADFYTRRNRNKLGTCVCVALVTHSFELVHSGRLIDNIMMNHNII